MHDIKEALSIVEKVKPECKAIECLEFEDFTLFAWYQDLIMSKR